MKTKVGRFRLQAKVRNWYFRNGKDFNSWSRLSVSHFIDIRF